MRLVSCLTVALTTASLNAGPVAEFMSESGEQRVSRDSLEAHVRELADTIGERNIFHPEALTAAADFLAGRVMVPPHPERARTEGWIWVRERG